MVVTSSSQSRKMTRKFSLTKYTHKKIIVDPKGTNYSKYAGVTLIKPNLKEFSEATGKTYNPKSKDFLALATEKNLCYYKKNPFLKEICL